MAVNLRVWDEVVPGRRMASETVTLESAVATPRRLIESRVRQEVERFNQSETEVFAGLVQPEESERILNGFRMKNRRTLDADAQVRRACASFEQNGFLLLVDGQQVTQLDETVALRADSEIQFVKLVPLVGG